MLQDKLKKNVARITEPLKTLERHLTLTVPLSTQVYKWVLCKLVRQSQIVQSVVVFYDEFRSF